MSDIVVDMFNLRYETNRKTIDEISENELRRFYVIMRIIDILERHPEIQIFNCRPNDMPQDSP